MTAPDSRDSVERVVAEMREELSYSVHVVEVSVSAFRAWADRLQALARGPQQAGEQEQRAEAAEARLAEVWADARTLAASVHGAFGALGSDPPEPILKLANRYFLMKRRGRRAALNGGQDDA